MSQKVVNLTPKRLVRKWEESRKEKEFARMRRDYSRTLTSPPLEEGAIGSVPSEPSEEVEPASPYKWEQGPGWIRRITRFDKSVAAQLIPKIVEPKPAKVGRAINSSMLVWMARNHIKQCKKSLEDWRWLDEPIHGELRGLPTTRGRAMMTNGVLVWIELTGDQGVFLGHWDNWISDLAEDEESTARREKKVKLQQQKNQEAERLLNLLLA